MFKSVKVTILLLIPFNAVHLTFSGKMFTKLWCLEKSELEMGICNEMIWGYLPFT